MNDSRSKQQEPSHNNDRQPWDSFWVGLLASGLVGAIAMLAFKHFPFADESGAATAYLASQVIALPMGMGVVASFFWRKLDFTIAHDAFGSMGVTGLGLFASMVVLNEGAICLMMAAPLLFFLVWAGVALGRLLWLRSPWLGASALPLLVLTLIVDSQLPHQHATTVTTEVLIQAPPEKVWPYVAAYPAIEAPPSYWLWQIGLPAPVQSTADGAFVGARRDCRFSGGIALEERIVEVQKHRLLAFDITKQPDHPEINGHFNIDRGRFVLRDNGDGSTTLVGTTWYRLHVYPTQYFNVWAADIVRQVHLRVMNHVKMLAERDA